MRLATLALLYAAQGVPNGLLIVALPAYLASRGLTGAQSGAYIGAAMLPWSLKLAAAPLMDRFQYRPMGRRRPWILLAQLAMIATLLATSTLGDPLAALGWLTAGAVAANVATVFQDVAVDGLAIDLVPREEQGLANGFMEGGRAVGVAAATAGGAYAFAAWGAGPTLALFAAVQSIFFFVALLVRERPAERLWPWSSGGGEDFGQPARLPALLRELWRGARTRSSATLTLLIFVFNAGKGCVVALLPILVVRELGWADTAYSELMAEVGLATGLFGLLVVGPLVDRVGRVRMMAGGIALYGAAMVALASVPGAWAEPWVLPSFLGAHLGLGVVVAIAFFATAMAVCRERVAATQFALYMMLSNLGFAAGAWLYGAFAEDLSAAGWFLVMGSALVVTAGAGVGLRLEPRDHG